MLSDLQINITRGQYKELLYLLDIHLAIEVPTLLNHHHTRTPKCNTHSSNNINNPLNLMLFPNKLNLPQVNHVQYLIYLQRNLIEMKSHLCPKVSQIWFSHSKPSLPQGLP